VSVEFTCEGCGVPVLDFGREAVPAHRLCATCEWCSEFHDPADIMEIRRRCEPGGWRSERQRRLMPEWLYKP
jgi:hypothetical protein